MSSQLENEQKNLGRYFDIFDHLFGFVHTQEELWEKVEKKSIFEGFKSLRVKAQGMPHLTLEEAYKNLRKIALINENQANELLNLELNVIKEHLILIKEAAGALKNGDVLYSNGYFNNDQIYFFLAYNGITVAPKIIDASEKNKYQPYKFAKDMPWLKDTSAIKGLLAFRFEKDQKFFDDSLFLKEKSLEGFFSFIITLKERNPYPQKSFDWILWNEQANCNLPYLIQSAILIHKTIHENGFSKVLFASRDCHHLFKIYKALYPKDEAMYFYSSRRVLYSNNSFYLDYVKKHWTPDALLVDGNGSGKSLKYFLTNHLKEERKYKFLTGADPEDFFSMNICGVDTEVLNYTDHGTLIDFNEDGPIFSPLEYNLNLLKPALECIAEGLKILNHFDLKIFSRDFVHNILNHIRTYGPVFAFVGSHEADHSRVSNLE